MANIESHHQPINSKNQKDQKGNEMKKREEAIGFSLLFPLHIDQSNKLTL